VIQTESRESLPQGNSKAEPIHVATRTSARLGDLLDPAPNQHLYLEYGTGMVERDSIPLVESQQMTD
jgi:hypothetical protein